MARSYASLPVMGAYREHPPAPPLEVVAEAVWSAAFTDAEDD